MTALPSILGNPWAHNSVWAQDSAYNLVRVVDLDNGQRALILNDNRSFQSLGRLKHAQWQTGHLYDAFALGPLLVTARRALVLGMGAGSSIITTRAAAPDIEVDAVEIDPVVVHAAREYFGLQPDDATLRIHVADARPWLDSHMETYDIVQVDLYHGGLYVPFYLTTVEFYQKVRDHLSEEGVLMLNVCDIGDKREILNAYVATLQQVFPTVAAMTGGASHIVFAFPRERSVDALRSRLEQADVAESFDQVIELACASLRVVHPPKDTPIFTDDHAPIEPMTRRMLASHYAAPKTPPTTP
jgi:spermidine synthase